MGYTANDIRNICLLGHGGDMAPDHIIPSIFDKAIAAVVADAVKAHVKE